ncbi:MAG: sensor histidine kinase [Spirulina sp.]
MTSSPDADALASLQLAYDRLQQQYQTLAAFLGTASHELRAPINQVISLHQLILEDLCESPEEEREFIGQANQAITRMLHNLDTLISLSKLDIGAISPVCEPIFLETVLNKVRQFTEMQCINRQCRLTVNPGPQPIWVLSDDRWLLQALISLVESALAAGSTMITLEPLENANVGEDGPSGNQPQDPPVVTLQLICNAPANHWPPNIPTSLTLADSPSPPNALPEGQSNTPLSHSFRYHLAHRILGHLGSAIHPSVSATDDPHCLTIQLSRADGGRNA